MSIMCPDHPRKFRSGRAGAPPRRTDGFSVVAAIFLLVVLAGLGAFMVNISTVQHATSAQDLQGTRAYHAARAGIEFGLYRVMEAAPSCGSTTLTFAGFSTAISCTALAYSEGSNTVTVYTITATASQGTPGTSTAIERQLQATVSR